MRKTGDRTARRTRRTRWSAAAATMLLTTGGLALAAPNASAYVPPDCYGSGNNQSRSCYGLDPIAEGCANDARTIYSLSTSVGYLEHRYSPYCNASWARISSSSAGTWFYIQTCYAGYVDTYTVPYGSTAYGNMVPGSGTTTTRVGDHQGHGPC